MSFKEFALAALGVFILALMFFAATFLLEWSILHKWVQ